MKIKSFANSFSDSKMNSKAISSVIAMFLILALVSLSLAVIWAKYVPFDKRNMEIELNEELEARFLEIPKLYYVLQENETKILVMKLGGKKTFVGHLMTTSTLKVNKTGNFSIQMVCENSPVIKNYNLFALELHVHNNFLPEHKFVFSKGALKIFQFGRNITKIGLSIEDSIDFDLNRSGLFLKLDNLLTDPVEVSDSSFAFFRIKYFKNVETYSNCAGSSV